LKPPVDVTVQVDVALPPAAADTLAGLHAIPKSGVGTLVTVNVTLASRTVAPLVPRAWNVDVPAAVPAATETVSVAFTLPFAGGVTEAGL
jgi:hypothetical protein